MEHFSELLNRPGPEDHPDIPPAETELSINCAKPSRHEIRKAIQALKNGRAVGIDSVPAEALTVDIGTSTEILYRLFENIWEEEEIPRDWKEGLLIKLPKKGDLRVCTNYRGITLLSIPGKVLNRILLERMKAAVDNRLRDQQAGFRQDRSCTDHIATLRIIVEQSLEWNSSLYVSFIDYEKLFGSYLNTMAYQKRSLHSFSELMREFHAEWCTEASSQIASMSGLVSVKDAYYHLSCFFLLLTGL